jgi:hypothetical protein
MKPKQPVIAMALFVTLCASIALAQRVVPLSPVAPPKLVLLVRQQTRFGSEGERRKLGIQMSRACDGLDVPNSWIDLESITGEPGALYFDPLDSFEQADKAVAVWGQLYRAHPELAGIQEQIKALVTSERTLIAVRRDDLGYRTDFIDLSKMRFMRVLEVRLRPGYENSFVEAFKILAAAYERINASTPWVVYQVNVGMPSPAFLVFVPQRALRQNDDLLSWRRDLRQAEGEERAHRMEQIAREAYQSTESHLYAVSPETSHVSREFAAGDPQFWLSGAPAGAKLSPGTDTDSGRKR